MIKKTIKIKSVSPWYNGRLKKIKQQKRNFESRWQRTKSIQDLTIFKTIRNTYNNKCHEEKIAYFRDLFAKNSGDQKKTYNLINKLTFGNKNIPYPPIENTTLSNQFAEFFKTKVDRIITKTNELVQSESLNDLV